VPKRIPVDNGSEFISKALPYSTSNRSYRTFQIAICGAAGWAKPKRVAERPIAPAIT